MFCNVNSWSKKSLKLSDVRRKQMELLVLRCHLKDPSQSILCYPIYLPSKGEGLSWSFWDWNLWLQGNLSILTLRSLLLSQSASIWQFIFVEFITLILVLFPCEMCHHFCLVLKCTAQEAKYICFSEAVKLQEVWNLWDWNGIFQEQNVSALIAFTQASLANLKVSATRAAAVLGDFYVHRPAGAFPNSLVSQFLNLLYSNYPDHYPNASQWEYLRICHYQYLLLFHINDVKSLLPQLQPTVFQLHS